MSEANILVVTDDSILSRAIRTVLSAKGYQVTTVDSSEDAPRLSCSGKYDLVLVDDDLYEGATVEICKAIRSVSEIPLILMNGDAPGKRGGDALRDLANVTLTKPFGVSELFACLRNSVGKPAAVSAI
jgi:two-component system, OmpR family, KDP operon response regulator KdpE